MKTIIKESLKKLITDRYLMALLFFLLLLAIILSIVVGFSIHPSELQLVSHYSVFGVTHYYRDQWLYLIVFVLFELIAAILHIILSIKLFIIKGRPLAAMFAWFGIGIVVLGWLTALAVLNVWKS